MVKFGIGGVDIHRAAIGLGEIFDDIAEFKYWIGAVEAVDPTAVESASTTAGIVVVYSAMLEAGAGTVEIQSFAVAPFEEAILEEAAIGFRPVEIEAVPIRVSVVMNDANAVGHGA